MRRFATSAHDRGTRVVGLPSLTRSTLTSLALSGGLAAVPAAHAVDAAASIGATADRQLPTLVAFYKELHQTPELSRHEERTSAKLAEALRSEGYTVAERVGVYPDGSKAWGIVGVLKNGAGPTVLIRTDMDALPVVESTGLPYASTVKAVNAAKQDVGVMHACGHDIHMTVFRGVAHALVAEKASWHGTVVLVGQPSEETIDGAKAMVADGFAERFPKADYVLDLHDTNDHAVGHIGIAPGPLLASSTSVEVVFHGVGAHGSAPATGKDPILMASEFVVLAQAIVSRQIPAQDPAVLTVGTFHAGTKNNIIPADATLGLTLRAYSEDARQTLLDGVKRTAEGVAVAYGIAPGRMPEVRIPESTTATVNDAPLAERMRQVAVRTLGESRVDVAKPIMGSEDVGVFTMDGRIPLAMFWLGAADPDRLAESKRTGMALPSPHSPLFAPVYEPAIRTGVVTMTAMAMDLLR